MNFQQMTLSELEDERTRLIGEINRIDGQFRELNGEMPQLLRREIQDLIERLVSGLLPNLFAPTLKSLKEIFPAEPQLTDVLPEKLMPPENSLWNTIKKLCGVRGRAPSQNLERQRILLRNILWNLSALPSNNGTRQYLFLLLQQKKQELLIAEKNADKVELDADELHLRRRETSDLLKECEREIARRPRGSGVQNENRSSPPNHYQPDDAPIFYSNSTSSDNYSGVSSSTNSNDYSNVSNSSENQSSGEDFSFGGGGDFAGGGAGGSWDNYS